LISVLWQWRTGSLPSVPFFIWRELCMFKISSADYSFHQRRNEMKQGNSFRVEWWLSCGIDDFLLLESGRKIKTWLRTYGPLIDYKLRNITLYRIHWPIFRWRKNTYFRVFGSTHQWNCGRRYNQQKKPRSNRVSLIRLKFSSGFSRYFGDSSSSLDAVWPRSEGSPECHQSLWYIN
jgi:hypothetical protein